MHTQKKRTLLPPKKKKKKTKKKKPSRQGRSAVLSVTIVPFSSLSCHPLCALSSSKPCSGPPPPAAVKNYSKHFDDTQYQAGRADVVRLEEALLLFATSRWSHRPRDVVARSCICKSIKSCLLLGFNRATTRTFSEYSVL